MAYEILNIILRLAYLYKGLGYLREAVTDSPGAVTCTQGVPR